jgi:hypothetical protein
MKYLVLYFQSVVGFANSLEQFKEENAKRTYPYNYEDENLTLVELRPDVFGMTNRIEGSNFADYQRKGKKDNRTW